MKKHISKRYLNKKKSHTKLLLRGLLYSLLQHGHIETILERAKTLKSYTDQELSYCISGNRSSGQEMIEKRYGSKKVGKDLIDFCEFLKKNYPGVNSGFTSIVRTRNRDGDNSVMAELSLIGFDEYMKSIKSVKSKKKVSKKAISKGKSSTKQKKAEVKKAETTKKTSKETKREVAGSKGSRTEKRKGLLARLKGRILGRKIEDPNANRQHRARSRSGI